MAEFCLECWNELNGEALSERAVLLSKRAERCEHCGRERRIVVRERPLRARRARRRAERKKTSANP